MTQNNENIQISAFAAHKRLLYNTASAKASRGALDFKYSRIP